jgi:hypothetical protein
MGDKSLTTNELAWRAIKARWELKKLREDATTFDEALDKLRDRRSGLGHTGLQLADEGRQPSRLSDEVGATATGDDNVQIIDDGEVEEIGDLGNEFDDPEGWMREIPDYWDELPNPVALTPQSWLRHRIRTLIDMLSRMQLQQQPAWPSDRIPEMEWRRLYEAEFGDTTLPCVEPTAPDSTQSVSLHPDCQCSEGRPNSATPFSTSVVDQGEAQSRNRSSGKRNSSRQTLS